jgi:hypothetical protein
MTSGIYVSGFAAELTIIAWSCIVGLHVSRVWLAWRITCWGIEIMPAKGSPIWLKCVLLFLLFSASSGSAASAQTPATPDVNLETILARERTVWITDSTGREEKTRIVGVSGGIVTVNAGENIRRLRTTDVLRVRVRQSDPVINGALIGAGAAVASGLFLCSLTEPWENCRDDVGPMFRIGAIGAGVGIAVDALIRGRRTVYEAAPGLPRLQAAPIVTGYGGGLQVSLSF